jgi:hypothetical protein
MSQILFKSEVDVTDEWSFYIENEARSLAQRDRFAIENYADREATNPEMIAYLNSAETQDLQDNSDDNASFDTKMMRLSFAESAQTLRFPSWLRFRFNRLKKKVQRVFCQVVRGIGAVDVKTIIGAVLVALIPAFGGGVAALLLPLIIALVASLLKFGLDATCPV